MEVLVAFVVFGWGLGVLTALTIHEFSEARMLRDCDPRDYLGHLRAIYWNSRPDAAILQDLRRRSNTRQQFALLVMALFGLVAASAMFALLVMNGSAGDPFVFVFALGMILMMGLFAILAAARSLYAIRVRRIVEVLSSIDGPLHSSVLPSA